MCIYLCVLTCVCVSMSVCLHRIFTLYSKSLPLDVACRVWDVFCRDGEEFLFRTGLGILRLFEDVLLQACSTHSSSNGVFIVIKTL